MVQPLSAGEQPVRHALALREASAESQLVAGIYRQLAPALRCGREVGSGGEPAGRVGSGLGLGLGLGQAGTERGLRLRASSCWSEPTSLEQ